MSNVEVSPAELFECFLLANPMLYAPPHFARPPIIRRVSYRRCLGTVSCFACLPAAASAGTNHTIARARIVFTRITETHIIVGLSFVGHIQCGAMGYDILKEIRFVRSYVIPLCQGAHDMKSTYGLPYDRA